MMHVDVTGRGEVSAEDIRYARERIEGLDRSARTEVLRAHVVLRQEGNPRIERQASAEGQLDLKGRIVRGHVAEAAMPAAIDALARHLERQLRRFVERNLTERRRPAMAPEGEWRHGEWTPPRPTYFPRPPEERRIVRRKTFATAPMTPLEAAADLEALDHGFYLFRESETDADAVVYRRDDGRLGVIGPAGAGWAEHGNDDLAWEESRMSGPSDLEDAVAEMNELDHRFMYFVNAETDRGNVLYMRYDGDYGLIEPR
jgi:ribosomal subunit interface protein